MDKNNFKPLRKAMGLTQQQVADEIGITRQAYNHYETGRRKPDTNMLRLLADVFGCSIDRLLNYEANARYPSSQTHAIPILGTVKAGYNKLAEEDIEDYEYVDVKNPEDYFFLHITGDSMEPEIHSGDLALVHKQNDVENGELAVVMIDGEEATIKRVVKSGRDIVLQPFNSSYQVMMFSGRELSNIKILGKVVKTTRNW